MLIKYAKPLKMLPTETVHHIVQSYSKYCQALIKCNHAIVFALNITKTTIPKHQKRFYFAPSKSFRIGTEFIK